MILLVVCNARRLFGTRCVRPDAQPCRTKSFVREASRYCQNYLHTNMESCQHGHQQEEEEGKGQTSISRA